MTVQEARVILEIYSTNSAAHTNTQGLQDELTSDQESYNRNVELSPKQAFDILAFFLEHDQQGGIPSDEALCQMFGNITNMYTLDTEGMRQIAQFMQSLHQQGKFTLDYLEKLKNPAMLTFAMFLQNQNILLPHKTYSDTMNTLKNGVCEYQTELARIFSLMNDNLKGVSIPSEEARNFFIQNIQNRETIRNLNCALCDGVEDIITHYCHNNIEDSKKHLTEAAHEMFSCLTKEDPCEQFSEYTTKLYKSMMPEEKLDTSTSATLSTSPCGIFSSKQPTVSDSKNDSDSSAEVKQTDFIK